MRQQGGGVGLRPQRGDRRVVEYFAKEVKAYSVRLRRPDLFG
jgi:hypothetical protein